MMLFDRKRAMNQILGPSEKDTPEAEDPAHMISKEAIAAVHAKDHAGFAAATKALFMHYSQSDEGNASEEQEE